MEELRRLYAVVLRQQPGNCLVFTIPDLAENSPDWSVRDIYDPETDMRIFLASQAELVAKLKEVFARPDIANLRVRIVFANEIENSRYNDTWLELGELWQGAHTLRRIELAQQQRWQRLIELLPDEPKPN